MNTLDNAVASLLVQIQRDVLTNFFAFVTHFGDKYALLGVLILSIVFIFKKKINIRSGLVMILSIVGALSTSTLLKHMIARERPLNGLLTETGFAFPSNHATMAIVVYGLCIYVVLQSRLSSCVKRICAIILSLLILCIGLSRVYLGVHFFTDVIGGYLVGGIFLALGIWFDKRVSKKL